MEQCEELLHMEEEEFDIRIQSMSDKVLIDTVWLLQKEMNSKQERFNKLSQTLQSTNSHSSSYADISQELVDLQAQLALLMGRNMKCFTQQAANENKKIAHPTESLQVVEFGATQENIQRTHLHSEDLDESSLESCDTDDDSGIGVKSNTDFTSEYLHPKKFDRNIHNQYAHSGESVTSVSLKNVYEPERVVSEQKVELVHAGTVQNDPTRPSKISVNVIQKSNISSRIETSSVVNPVTSDNTASRNHRYDGRTLKEGAINDSDSTRQAFDDGLSHKGVNVSHESDRLRACSGGQGDDVERSDGLLVLDGKTDEASHRPINYDGTALIVEDEHIPREGEPELSPHEALHNYNVHSASVIRSDKMEQTSDTTSKKLKTVCFSEEENVILTNSDTSELSADEQGQKEEESQDEFPTREDTGEVHSDELGEEEREVLVDHKFDSIRDSIELLHETFDDYVPPGYMERDMSAPVKDDSQEAKSGDLDLTNGGGFKVTGGDIDGFTHDEKVPDKVTLKDWDPTKLLRDLYKVELVPEAPSPKHEFINMEGYMEKLPINKKKATLLKTWKRRFFQAKDGFLYYSESTNSDRSSGFMQLSGGSVSDIGSQTIGIDDGRGRYLVLRCPSDQEFTDWMTSLKSQTAENYEAMYVKPVLTSPPHKKRKVVIVDIGSCSVRAGILGEKPSLPQLFFPALTATNKSTGKHYFGYDALKPEVRSSCLLSYLIRPSVKMDQAAIDMDSIPLVFEKIFNDLQVDPSEYWLMFSAPGNFSDKIKEKFMDMLINRFHIIGANIINQSLLSLYSYNATSGIVVDIGERLEIVPVTDGYIAEAGVTRQPYGGHRITEALNTSFTESRYRFFTDVEFQIVRVAMEKTCYVAKDYNEELKKLTKNPAAFTKSLDLKKYELPAQSWTSISHDLSRFKSVEGLFNMDMWGMDNPPLHKLILKAVQACPMDTRREMWRSIFLSGGVTLMPGFVERLCLELEKLVPSTIKIEIHASPQRYHSAYIGACTMANLNVFEEACISATEWQRDGVQSLKKWHMY